MEYKKSDKYKNVYFVRGWNGGLLWRYQVTVNGKRWYKCFKTEKEAALALDKQLLTQGLEPINILKRK